MQNIVLTTYATALFDMLGRPPTVMDALSETVASAGKKLPILVWDDNFKKEIGTQTAAVATRQPKSGHVFGMGFSSPPRRPTMMAREYRRDVSVGSVSNGVLRRH